MGSKPIFHHFIVVLGWSLTWSRLKNRFWWILPWKRYPKIRNQDLRRECCSLRTADRFSSLIAAEGRFAKRPSAAMSEEKRSAVRRLQHSRLRSWFRIFGYRFHGNIHQNLFFNLDHVKLQPKTTIKWWKIGFDPICGKHHFF